VKVGGGSGRLVLLGIAALICLGLLAPGGALAANVVNGDFETGTLSGWQVHRALEAGNWFAYSGTSEPISKKRGDGPIQEPPQGRYAAIADEIDPDTLILSQDVALGAGLSHRLNLLAYYRSYVPIAVPAPDTLSADSETLGGQANQQYRIDVMKPTAPIESVDPADILLTVFRTQPGAPKVMGPTRLTADLSPFAGQTVRLRIAVAAHEEALIGGVDAVAVESAPPGQLPPLKKGAGSGSTRLGFGKVKANASDGSAILPVKVPGAGSVKAKSTAKLIKPAKATAAKAGTVKLLLKPTSKALATLRKKRKLRVKVAVTFKPRAGKAETATVPVVLKLKAAPSH
jgi:hypothetical protein